MNKDITIQHDTTIGKILVDINEVRKWIEGRDSSQPVTSDELLKVRGEFLSAVAAQMVQGRENLSLDERADKAHQAIDLLGRFLNENIVHTQFAVDGVPRNTPDTLRIFMGRASKEDAYTTINISAAAFDDFAEDDGAHITVVQFLADTGVLKTSALALLGCTFVGHHRVPQRVYTVDHQAMDDLIHFIESTPAPQTPVQPDAP